MIDPLEFVDPFLGNTTTDLPEDSGIAMAWSWLKAETGNTHPGACLPFGMVSACAYSGAYVTGYGCNAVSTSGPPASFFDRKTATGFTHFHQSGTGMIGAFYNYLKVIPASYAARKRWTIRTEDAAPGRYSCTLEEDGIGVELTVSHHCAVHRYTFSQGIDTSRIVSVELSSIGLHPDLHEGLPGTYNCFAARADCSLNEDGTVSGSVRVNEIDLYFVILAESASGAVFWEKEGEQREGESFSCGFSSRDESHPFGVQFSFPENPTEVVLKVAFSFRSVSRARRNLEEVRRRTLGAVAEDAASSWRSVLGRIEVDGDAERKTIFYSALYHSLIKPADFEGENPFRDVDGPCSIDLATLWDQCKTLMPLLNFLYPEQGSKVVRTLAWAGEKFGFVPNALLLDGQVDRFEHQAAGLGYIVIADAFFRGVPGIDWERTLAILSDAFHRGRYRRFLRRGKVRPFSHTINLSMAAASIASLAEALGHDAILKEMRRPSGAWNRVFDRKTAMLSERSDYYEGTAWNYSFPLLHDQQGRLALFPSDEKAVEVLDRFFGYYDVEATEPTKDASPPPFTAPRIRPRKGANLKRFEGLNNEPDMESPWVYHYLGRPDRTCEVVKSALRHRYSTGPGGLAGNDDSGGLSSWFVWAAMGLFPVPGRGLYLLTLPEFKRVRVMLPAGELRIGVSNFSQENVYVQSVSWNGRTLEQTWLSHEQIRGGGELIFTGSSTPTSWARANRPPSFGFSSRD